MRLDDTASVCVARVMWTYKGDMNSAIGQNAKEPSSSAKSTEASFDDDDDDDDDDSNTKNLIANKVCWP